MCVPFKRCTKSLCYHPRALKQQAPPHRATTSPGAVTHSPSTQVCYRGRHKATMTDPSRFHTSKSSHCSANKCLCVHACMSKPRKRGFVCISQPPAQMQTINHKEPRQNPQIFIISIMFMLSNY